MKLDALAVPWARGPKSYFRGCTALARGDLASAKVLLESALPSFGAEKDHAGLGEIFASLGRSDEAIREGRKAVEEMPELKNAWEGPGVTANMVMIYAGSVEEPVECALEISQTLRAQPVRRPR